jgi:hypothetical protein
MQTLDHRTGLPVVLAAIHTHFTAVLQKGQGLQSGKCLIPVRFLLKFSY